MDKETINKQQAAQQLRDWNRSVEDQKRTQIKLDFEIDRLKNMMIDRDQLIKVCLGRKKKTVVQAKSSPKPVVTGWRID